MITWSKCRCYRISVLVGSCSFVNVGLGFLDNGLCRVVSKN